MKLIYFVSTLATAFIPLPALASQNAATNADGMRECIVKSVDVALQTYQIENPTAEFPSVVVSKSDGSPSNGIDVMVTIDSKKTYYVIASPISTPDHRKLLGCSSARVGYTK